MLVTLIYIGNLTQISHGNEILIQHELINYTTKKEVQLNTLATDPYQLTNHTSKRDI
jgi:hypothetical protein